MESIWSQGAVPAVAGPVEHDLHTQVLVIGAGMAGILTAYELKQRGIPAVVVDAGMPGAGQTGRTTAKITAQHGAVYGQLAASLGAARAAQYAAVNQESIERYSQIIAQEQIDCEFVRCPAYLYTLADGEFLQREAQAQQAAGLPACFTTQTELPFPVAGAVKVEHQARFHPLRFLQALCPSLEIHPHSPVVRVEDGRAVLENECVVTAEQIVFACHYPFVNVPGFYFARMHQERSYVLALKNAVCPQGMYLGVDEDAGWSLRTAGQLLLLGGAGHRTGENQQGGRYEQLRQKAREWWPHSQEAACWSAQDCMTLDGVPYIGRFAPSQPEWYVATGFGKWGMTSSMAAACLLARLISGETPAEAELFSPSRFAPSASAENFLHDAAHAVRDVSRQVFGAARAAAQDLPCGHGGVVEAGGEKVGAYHAPDGQFYFVSTRCPHLGCQLEWNPDEKSWDCPCHGSRFDFRGRRLDGPAQQDLRPAP